MTDLKPRLKTTRFDVSCLPEDHPDCFAFTLHVEYRPKNRWIVTDGRNCYDIDGNRDRCGHYSEYEWLTRFRFNLVDAINVAKRLAPQMKVDGMTAERALALYNTKEDRD